MIRVVHPGSRIRMLTFYPSRIPGPGVKKAPDPGSGSATLIDCHKIRRFIIYHLDEVMKVGLNLIIYITREILVQSFDL
jgi:hypothetical protein